MVRDTESGQAMHDAELLELGDALLVVDGDWRIIRVNRAQQTLSKKPRSETVGRVMWEVWPDIATHESNSWREYHRCMEQRVPVQFEEYFAPLDMWTGVTAYPISTGGIAIFFRDITAQRRAEEALRSSVTRANAISENMRDSLVVLEAVRAASGDVEGWRYVHANAGALVLLGMPRDAVVGRLLRDVLPERAGVEQRLSRVLSTGEPERYETEFRGDALLLTLFRIDENTVASAAFDITERRRAEDDVRAERDFNSAVLDTTASLIVVLDTEGNIVRFSRACERITGWAESEVKGKNVFEMFIPGGDLRETIATFRQLRQGDIPNQHRNRWRMKDGSERLIDWSNTAITDDGGRVTFIIGTGMDITERARAENRSRALYESELIGLFFWTVDGGVTDANDKFLEMTGYTREDLRTGRIDWVEMTPPEWRPLDEVALASFKATGRSPPFEKEYVRKDGTRLPIIVGGAMLDETRDEGVAFVLDITDRKRAEEALRAADLRKDEFLGVLSHELRNPLAPIRNAVYVMGHANPGSDQAERARTIIERQVDHLTRLVEDLLDVRRIASGKLRLRRESVDVVQQVGETVEDMRPLFVQHGLALELHTPPGLVHVNGDRTRIAQVVGNLLHNTLKFTDRGGSVSVAVEVHDGDVVIRVRDTGVGIAPDMMNQIFEPFVQNEKTLDRNRGGLGLGLALVRGIAELHGGTVTAHSEGLGQGTEFVVTLPAAVEAPIEPPTRLRAPAVSSKRRVLVIEDNVDAGESLRDLLELMAGHEVHVATDGHAGVAAAREYKPDVVVCDLGLPGIDGYEVARRIRANGAAAGARLVALSGYASAEDAARALQAGFDFHLAKPPSAERLLALVADATSASQQHLPGGLATGHHELDVHHASILAEAAKLRAGVDAGGVLDSMRLLERHAVADFDYEEEAMEDVQYPDLTTHREQHREFLIQLRRLQERVRGEGPTPENVGAVALAVEAWLPHHVLNEDRRFAAFVETRRAAAGSHSSSSGR
jgi:PAS domain S-box-containing protein/hemerythrin-like metal-binding protein